MKMICHHAVRRVLLRLNIPPEERFGPLDQDAQYTACRAEELELYIDLYASQDLGDDERDVLCCFILESINELIQLGRPHSRQSEALALLFANQQLHQSELEYWMDISDPNEDHWWPITRPLLQFSRSLPANESSNDE